MDVDGREPTGRSARNTALAEYHEVSLTIRPDLTFEEWEELWASLSAIQRSHLFWVGDALNFSERQFSEKWAQVLDSYANESQRGAKWVCERIEPQRRRENLTYTHHKIVASLIPVLQDELLAKAEFERTPDGKVMSTRELTKLVENARPRPRKAPDPSPVLGRPAQSPDDSRGAGKPRQEVSLGLPASVPDVAGEAVAATPEENDEQDIPEERGEDRDPGQDWGGYVALEEHIGGDVVPMPRIDIDTEQRRLYRARAATEGIATWLSNGSPDIDTARILEEREILWRAVEAAQDVLLGIVPARVTLRTVISELIEKAGAEKSLRQTA